MRCVNLQGTVNVPLHRLHTGLGVLQTFLHGKLLVMSGMKWRKNFMFYVRRSYLFIGLIMKGEPGLVSGTW